MIRTDQVELLGQLLRVMDVRIQTGSEGQRKLTLGNATILAYCLRWPEFRVRRPTCCLILQLTSVPAYPMRLPLLLPPVQHHDMQTCSCA